MKIIGLIGKPSRDKSYLMLYLGKLLAVRDKVSVVTDDQWFLPALDSYEHSDQLHIYKEVPVNEEVAYTLIDVASPSENSYDVAIYISGIDRPTVEINVKVFAACQAADEKVYIFQNVLMDGKINESYLCQRFGISQKSHQVRTVYLNDNDMAVNIENGYNETIDIRGLSKRYKKLLLELVGTCSQKSLKELKQDLRTAERSR